jgi:hypothetical protein
MKLAETLKVQMDVSEGLAGRARGLTLGPLQCPELIG